MRKSVLNTLPLAKPLAAAAVLACVCVGQAQAQTNVTIYGRVVDGINYQSNQKTGSVDSNGNAILGSKWSIDGNIRDTSLFGFMGTEDLGGGLKALFQLENGFDGSTGNVNGGSGLWTRRSVVGLSGGFGTLKVGKDLTLPSDAVSNLDPVGQQAMSSVTLAKARNVPIYNNQIDYTTPNMGGFSAEGVYGMGEVAGSAKKGSTGGLQLAFVQPNYEFRVIYDVANDANGQYSSLFQYSKELTIGGTVTLDKLKLYAAFQNLSAPAVVASQGNPDKSNQFWVGANYQITPAFGVFGGAFHVKLNHDSGTANLFMMGTDYYLSKRTRLYASIGTVRNSALTSFAVETGTSAPGVNQNAFYSGISHTF